MNPQTIARVTGVLFVITFIAAISPALFLYGPLLNDPRYILGGGAADNGASLGALLELILIVANIGTAVVLYPVLKPVNEILALGFVTARVVECAFIAVGVLSVLSMVTLRQEAAAGADAGSLLALGESLVALQSWTFLLRPGFAVGVGNGLILGYLMYRSGLVPRGLAVLGLIAGPCSSPVSWAYCSGSSSQCPCWGPHGRPGVLVGVGARHLANRQGFQCARSGSPVYRPRR